MSYQDSTHTWHVAKTGGDGNGGHAQQYPIDLAADAKLTIMAAVNAAVSSDTVIIWPGMYEENVDLSGKAIRLFSDFCSASSIAPANGIGINCDDFCELENMYIKKSRSGDPEYGINAQTTDGVIIKNCRAYGSKDGLIATGAQNLKATNSIFSSTYDGGGVSGSGVVFEKCHFSTDGSFGDVDIRAFIVTGGEVVFRNCTFKVSKVNPGDKDIIGVLLNAPGNIIFENCYVIAATTGTHTGYTYGLHSTPGCGAVKIVAGHTVFKATSAEGTPVDVNCDAYSILALMNCLYDTTGGAGTIRVLSDEVLDEIVDNDGNPISLRQSQKLILAILTGKCSGGGTTTLTFRDINDSKDRLIITVDANGNRTVIGTRDAS